jgi:hypothetical protein
VASRESPLYFGKSDLWQIWPVVIPFIVMINLCGASVV